MRKSYLAVMLAAPLVLTAGSGGAAPALRPDRTFLDDAASGGWDKVQDAQLAQEKATSPEVKQFASQMLADHTQPNEDDAACSEQASHLAESTNAG